MAQVKSLFRNQLVLDDQRALFDYWQSKCNGDSLPRRRDICPSGFVPYLTNVSLIDVVTSANTRQYSYRLAGSGLRNHFGREVTGKYIEEVFDPDSFRYWQRVLDVLVERQKPSCGSVQCDSGSIQKTQFWMRLPLVDENGSVNMILSHDISSSLSAVSKGGLNRVAIV